MASIAQNKQVIFKKIPTEFPVPGEHMEVQVAQFDLNSTKLEDGEFLIKNLYLSLDPYMRGRMRPSEKKSYSEAFAVGSVLSGHGVGQVIKSNNPSFKEGDVVVGFIGWEEYSHIRAGPSKMFRVIEDPKAFPLSYYIGVLGMPGMTAFVGLHKIGNPKKGETIFISAAAGAVGQLVGQLAKNMGLRVVGSAGDDEKVNYLVKELKFDAAFNYKKGELSQHLSEHCPAGIDIYWENVGGKTLETVINHCNVHSRIIACGMISQYNTTKPEGIFNLIAIVPKRIRIEGFIVSDDWATYWPQFIKEIPVLLKENKFTYKEDVVVGIEKAPDAFVGMLQGKNFGKQVIKIGEL